MNLKTRLVMVSTVLICVAGVLWMASTSARSLTTLTYSQFLQQVEAGQVASVVVMGRNSGAVQAICRLTDGSVRLTVLPSDYRDAMTAMRDRSVNIEIRDSSAGSLQPLVKASPFLLLDLSGDWQVSEWPRSEHFLDCLSTME